MLPNKNIRPRTLDTQFCYGSAMKSLLTVMEPLSLWVLFSLLAIAFVGTKPQVGLAIAILGGVLMGLSSIVSYDSQCREVANHGKERSQDSSSNP